MVGADVRKVEAEIDRSIQAMPVWSVKRDVLLRRLMTIWRDGLELVHMMAAHAAIFGLEEGFRTSLAGEHMMAAGAYQSLKWAMQYAKDDGIESVSDEDLVNLVMKTAAPYQALVDALKLGIHGKAEFSVDEGNRVLTVYEGGEASGHDAAIVDRDHVSVPFHAQQPLIEDSDQLTVAWTAGEYRKYYQWADSLARDAETETILAQAGPLAPKQEIMKRPVVVELPSPRASLARVQEDLTLTIAKATGSLTWKIDSWHDCPLVQIGSGVFGVSVAIRTLARLDDYMLRAAVLNDPEQYAKVSGLREERMIAICRKAFEKAGWTFVAHHRLTDPPREIDGYATRGSEICVLQLKSTLRPQSPWEVHKRNEDVLEGIRHTAEVLGRIGAAATGFVITDGYEGDYATWKESLATGIPVATLQDVEWVTQNPREAFDTLARRAGIDPKSSPQKLTDRSVDLCGWKLVVVSQAKPSTV